MNIGERIKRIRDENGLTLTKFGGRLGVSAQAISLIEKGTNAPSEQTVRSICREFRINEEWLRTGEGEPRQATYQDALWDIVQARGLDHADYALIAGIMEMPAETRKAIISAILVVAFSPVVTAFSVTCNVTPVTFSLMFNSHHSLLFMMGYRKALISGNIRADHVIQFG